MEKRKQVFQYNFIKAIATLLVFFGHGLELSFFESPDVTASNFPYFNVAFQGRNIISFLQAFIYGFHMPLFMAITGAVFILAYKEKNNVGKWVSKRFKRIILPYFIIGIFILVPVRYLIGYYGVDDNVIKVIFNDILLSKDCNYLWYLLVIFEIGVLMLLFYKFVKIKKPITQFLVLFLLLILSAGSNLLQKLPFQMNRTCQYMFWYYLGMMFELYKDKVLDSFKRKKTAAVIFFLVYIISFVGYRVMLSIVDNELYTGIILAGVKVVKMGLSYVMAVIGSLSVVLLCYGLKNENNKFLSFINKHSFKIYLWHSIFMFAFCKLVYLIVPSTSMNNLLYIVCVIMKIVVAALLTTCICFTVDLYHKRKLKVQPA